MNSLSSYDKLDHTLITDDDLISLARALRPDFAGVMAITEKVLGAPHADYNERGFAVLLGEVPHISVVFALPAGGSGRSLYLRNMHRPEGTPDAIFQHLDSCILESGYVHPVPVLAT